MHNETIDIQDNSVSNKAQKKIRNVRTDTMQRFLAKVTEAGRKNTLIGQLLLLSARAEITGRMLYQRLGITSVSFRRAVESGSFERDIHKQAAERMVDALAAGLNAGVLPVRVAEVSSIIDMVDRMAVLQNEVVMKRRQLETVLAGIAIRKDPETSTAAMHSHLAALEDDVEVFDTSIETDAVVNEAKATEYPTNE